MRIKGKIAGLLILVMLLITGCANLDLAREEDHVQESGVSESSSEESSEEESSEEASSEAESTEESSEDEPSEPTGEAFDLSMVPPYSGEPSVPVHDNLPFYTEKDLKTETFETYSPLDELGRCGVAFANLDSVLQPEGSRESISEIHPTGWKHVEYDFLKDPPLYNRCHLIAFMLAGENANEQNLITGTGYMNREGMLPYEAMVDEYIDRTGHHVLYRVTPIFEGDNLVASGVLMEAQSLEDDEIRYCVYCYNVQPGVSIDYATGESEADGTVTAEPETVAAEVTYILNTNSHKFHIPTCPSVDDMAEHNKEPFAGTREEAIAAGYEPCQRCNP